MSQNVQNIQPKNTVSGSIYETVLFACDLKTGQDVTPLPSFSFRKQHKQRSHIGLVTYGSEHHNVTHWLQLPQHLKQKPLDHCQIFFTGVVTDIRLNAESRSVPFIIELTLSKLILYSKACLFSETPVCQLT